ncbi:MAG TPA: energy transducer TonB [Gammaproteobacteria bacterium]|nr:energy transducer TonB [Gammaproteobacteria bacterium]
MDLTAFPVTTELPRPFIVACVVSLAVHAGVAGWYQLNSDARSVQLPRPTLQVKVHSLRERISIAPAPKRMQAVVQPAAPRQKQALVSKPSPSPVKTQNQPEKKPEPRNVARKPAPEERSEHAENTPDAPSPVLSSKEIADNGPTYTPPSSNNAILNNPKPDYPRIALRRGIEGLVLLHVDVDERGHPIEIQVRKSAGFRPLDIAALKAVRHWRFLPALRNGVAVRASIEVPIRFRIDRMGRSDS